MKTSHSEPQWQKLGAYGDAQIKPLVEALKRVDAWFREQKFNGALMQDVAALASVKEGK